MRQPPVVLTARLVGGRHTPAPRSELGQKRVQGREGKVIQVCRRRWVIHTKRLNRENAKGALTRHPVLLPLSVTLSQPTAAIPHS